MISLVVTRSVLILSQEAGPGGVIIVRATHTTVSGCANFCLQAYFITATFVYSITMSNGEIMAFMPDRQGPVRVYLSDSANYSHCLRLDSLTDLSTQHWLVFLFLPRVPLLHSSHLGICNGLELGVLLVRPVILT